MKKITIGILILISIAALGFVGVAYFNRQNQKTEKKMVRIGFTQNLTEITGEVTAIEPQLENITIKTGTPAIFRSYTIRPAMLSGIKMGDIVKIKTVYRDIHVKKIEVLKPKKQATQKPDNKTANKEPSKDAAKK